MKLLSTILSSLFLLACGGSETLVADPPNTPRPAANAATVSGGSAVALHMYQALYGMAPSNAMLVTHTAQASADSSAFASSLEGNFSSTSHTTLAKLVLGNLGVTASTVTAVNGKGESEYAILLDAVQQIFAAFPTMRGQVILNMTNLLEGLESDVTYGAAATGYNTQATANFSYSSNAANTSAAVVSMTPASPITPLASLASGSFYRLAYAGTDIGIDQRKATANFSGSGAMSGYAAANFDGTPSTNELPSLGAAVVAELSGDDKVTIGRWNGGALSGKYYAMTMPTLNANQGFHYAIGVPPASLPTDGSSKCYVLAAATHPTIGDGSIAPGMVVPGAQVKIVFGATGALAVDMVFAVGSSTVAIQTQGGIASPIAFGSNGAYYSASSPAPFTYATSDAAGNSIAAYMFLAGASSERLGMSFMRYKGGGGNPTSVFGAAYFTEATCASTGGGGTTPPVVAKVAAGSIHTVALKTDGTLWSWGYSSTYGQVGDGTYTNRIVPTKIGSATNWSAVSAGVDYTVAVRTDGTLWAWGRNDFGQLGAGTTTSNSSPTQIGTGTTWSSVSAGNYHVLALKTDGTLWGWGAKDSGALGDGTTSGTRTTPVQIGTGTTWSAISAGYSFSIALQKDGTLWAWGKNDHRQLGDGTATNRTTPIQIGTSTNWSVISAGDYSTFGLRTDGTLWAWGWNNAGQLGNGTLTDLSTPTQIGTATWSAISAGSQHTVAVKTDKTVWAWGYNNRGQLGDGTYAYKTAPVQIGAGTTWSAVDAGPDYTMGLKADGTLWGWGYNNYGELGDGTTSSYNAPTLTKL